MASSRLGIAANQIASGLATLEASLEKGGTRHSIAFSVDNLIDFIVGGLRAPVSPETAQSAGQSHDIDFRVMVAHDPSGA